MTDSSSKSEREGLQDGCNIYIYIYMIYGVEMVVLPKTGGTVGGGRAEDS